jgi:hypothetical protein
MKFRPLASLFAQLLEAGVSCRIECKPIDYRNIKNPLCLCLCLSLTLTLGLGLKPKPKPLAAATASFASTVDCLLVG